MSIECEVVELPEQPALVQRKVVRTMGLGPVMGKAYVALYDHLKAVGVKLDENTMPYCLYTQIDWVELMKPTGFFSGIKMMFKKWHLEMGVRLQSAVSDTGAFEQSVFPRGQYIRAIHMGPYHRVSDTYKTMVKWAEAQNLKMGPSSIEEYTNSPTDTPKEELKTICFIPITN